MTATTEDLRTTIKTWATVGEDGRLTLDVAPGHYEVVLVRTPPLVHPEYLSGAVGRTAGSIPDFPDCDDGFAG